MTQVSMSIKYLTTHLPPSSTLTLTPNPKEVLRMILGNTKWVLDFYHFIVDELFDLTEEFEPVFSDSEALAQKGELSFMIPVIDEHRH